MEKAYIIMAHKSPEQLLRLIKRLDDGQSMFFIHIDKTAEILPFEILNIFGDLLQFVDRVDSGWGKLGSAEAALNGLRAVKNHTRKFDRVLLLSGQDYPIKSNAYINDFFKKSPYSVFVDYFPIPNYKKWPGGDRGGWYRVDKYYFGLKPYQLFCSRALNLTATFFPFLRRKMPKGLTPFTGSQWWSIDMYALNYILDYDAKHPEYRRFHRFTFVPDELYFQMILANSKDEIILKSMVSDNKRFMIWEKPDSAHPNLLKRKDFDAIRASDKLFARKFDAQADHEILDMIDREILLYQKSGAPVL